MKEERYLRILEIDKAETDMTPEEEKEFMTITADNEPAFTIGDVDYWTPEGLAKYEARIAKLIAKGPGPMFKFPDTYQVYIYSDDIHRVCGFGLRKAQLLLQKTRADLGRPKGAMISVSEFCMLNNMDERTFREGLDRLNA